MLYRVALAIVGVLVVLSPAVRADQPAEAQVISLSVDQQTLKSQLKLIARASGIKFQIDDGLPETVISCKVEGTAGEVVKKLSAAAGLAAELKDGVWHVSRSIPAVPSEMPVGVVVEYMRVPFDEVVSIVPPNVEDGKVVASSLLDPWSILENVAGMSGWSVGPGGQEPGFMGPCSPGGMMGMVGGEAVAYADGEERGNATPALLAEAFLRKTWRLEAFLVRVTNNADIAAPLFKGALPPFVGPSPPPADLVAVADGKIVGPRLAFPGKDQPKSPPPDGRGPPKVNSWHRALEEVARLKKPGLILVWKPRLAQTVTSDWAWDYVQRIYGNADSTLRAVSTPGSPRWSLLWPNTSAWGYEVFAVPAGVTGQVSPSWEPLLVNRPLGVSPALSRDDLAGRLPWKAYYFERKDLSALVESGAWMTSHG